MADMLEAGLDWLLANQKNFMTIEEVSISFPGIGTIDNVEARVPEVSAKTLVEGDRLSTHMFKFVVPATTFQNNDPVRGITVKWKDDLYDVNFAGQLLWQYDDPYKKQIILNTTWRKTATHAN